MSDLPLTMVVVVLVVGTVVVLDDTTVDEVVDETVVEVDEVTEVDVVVSRGAEATAGPLNNEKRASSVPKAALSSGPPRQRTLEDGFIGSL